jgi:hypothetical protein
MLNFAERTGCGAVIVVWSFLLSQQGRSIANDAVKATPARIKDGERIHFYHSATLL